MYCWSVAAGINLTRIQSRTTSSIETVQMNNPRRGYRGGGRGGNRGSRGGRGGRGRGLGQGKRRSGYQGSGTPLTPVEPGFRFFKKSFLENPWHELETSFKDSNHNEDIELDLDSDGDDQIDIDGEKRFKSPNDQEKEISEKDEERVDTDKRVNNVDTNPTS